MRRYTTLNTGKRRRIKEFHYLCGVRIRILEHRIIVLLSIMWLLAGCGTSPRPSPRGEGEACRTLVLVDSLMYRVFNAEATAAENISIDISALPKGIYLLQFVGLDSEYNNIQKIVLL